MSTKRSLVILCMAGALTVCSALPVFAEHHGDQHDQGHQDQEQHDDRQKDDKHHDKGKHSDKDHHDNAPKIILRIPPLSHPSHGKVVIVGKHDDDERRWEGERGRFGAFADRLDLSRGQRVKVRRVVSSRFEEGKDISADLRRHTRRIRQQVLEGKRPGCSLRESLQRDWRRYFLYQWATLSRFKPLLTSKQEGRLLRDIEKGRDFEKMLGIRLDLTRGQRKEVRKIFHDFGDNNRDLTREARKAWHSMAREVFREETDRRVIRESAGQWSEAMTKLTVREGRLFRRIRPLLTRRQRGVLDDLFDRPLICLDYRGY